MTDDMQSQEEKKVVKLETTNRPPFSFKKMAIGWGFVILAIVIASIAVEVSVNGW